MKKNTVRKYMFAAGGLIVLAFLWKWLLPILLPFLLAWGLAALAEPLVKVLCRLRLPRTAASGLGITMTLVILILMLMSLLALLMRQLRLLAGVVPDLESTAQQGLQSLKDWLTDLADRSPQAIRPLLQRGVAGMFSDGASFIDALSSKLLGLASGLLSKLPDSALGFFTWLLASFMISARLPVMKDWITARLPEQWREKTLPALRRLKQSVFGWAWAQCKLMGLTFLVLTLGFFLLQISYGPLWAALISFVDVLPILGTGTVLVPWALVCWLQGDPIRALGLLGIYAVAWLLRSVLEPRFIGRQLGLDPLVTLFSMYAGFRLLGLGGLILAPLLAVTATQLASDSANRG